MKTTLVIRFSALGDVAMTIPVLYSVARRYPEDRFLFLTKVPYLTFFENKPSNLELISVDTEEEYQGTRGVFQLIELLKSKDIDQVADLHNVLRSRFLGFYFRLNGKKIAIIDKGYREKRALVRRVNKKYRPLPTSIERYQQVFEKLGYDATTDFTSIFGREGKSFSFIEMFTGKKEGSWVGVAPFAKHQGKIYPPEQMEEVLEILNKRPDTRIFLFGGKDDKKYIDKWITQFEHVDYVSRSMNFAEELLLMSYLDVMLTMDSGNMHLASLVKTPVVSIWGATHSFAGFYGYNQSPENIVQLDMDCRPCSVFGNKKCYKGNYPCMRGIAPEVIVEKINQNLQ